MCRNNMQSSLDVPRNIKRLTKPNDPQVMINKSISINETMDKIDHVMIRT
jgi:hypothetical protein